MKTQIVAVRIQARTVERLDDDVSIRNFFFDFESGENHRRSFAVGGKRKMVNFFDFVD